jgi:pyruvate,water dikinase
MKYLEKIEHLSKTDVDIAGGKAASLGEMTQYGLPVPPGFVVLSDAFDFFLETANLDAEIEANLDSADPADMHSIVVASEVIRTLIENATIPTELEHQILAMYDFLDIKLCAVRSSATAEDSADASWAGELESFLNVGKAELLAKVKNCWSSLFTPRAIYYRLENQLHEKKVSVAVVVQTMVQSEVSGIAFTVHPVTEDGNQLLIEAGFGLGEAIVSGKISPDNYVVNKTTMEIEEINIGHQLKKIVRNTEGNIEEKVPKSLGAKQKLTGREIIKLGEIVLLIEKHYGFPCDIEWALSGGKFYIVQSRPITTLAK